MSVGSQKTGGRQSVLPPSNDWTFMDNAATIIVANVGTGCSTFMYWCGAYIQC